MLQIPPNSHHALTDESLRHLGRRNLLPQLMGVFALLATPTLASLCEEWASRSAPWPLGTVLTYATQRYELTQVATDGLALPTDTTGPWVQTTDKACLNGQTDFFPTTVDARVRRFGIWTNGTINLNDRVDIAPWWMGSNSGPLNLGVYTYAMAYAFVGGDVLLRNNSQLQGPLWYTGTPTLQAGAGWYKPEQKTALTDLSIALPTTTFTAANGNQFAQPDQRLDLPVGQYGTVTVNSRATLVLHGGEYRITQLNVEPSATIEVAFGGTPLRVHVRDGIQFRSASRFTLIGGDASDILWMVHGSTGIHLGSYALYNPTVPTGAGFQGTLIAPATHVDVASDAAFVGTLYADALTIHQENHFFRFVPYDGNTSHRDSDGDGLEDSTELRIGSDPRGVDTDDDGLTDALELRGRGIAANGDSLHRFGAQGGMQPCWDAWVAWHAQPVVTTPSCREIDGAIPDRDVRDRLHPTRRDAFLRLLWQPQSDFWAAGRDSGLKFESVAADPWVNQAVASNFANRANHHPVLDSDVVAVSSREIALHLDAGPTASVNMPSDVELFGGAYLVASGGTNQGLGPWSYDLTTGGGFQIANSLDQVEIEALMKSFGETVPQSRSFWDLFTYGFLVLQHGSIPGAWGEAYDFGNDYFSLIHPGNPPRTLALSWVHEYGHDLNLQHPPSGDAAQWIWEGVMSYSIQDRLGCTLDQWSSTTRIGSLGDTRWCGDLPPKEVVPDSFSRAGQDWYKACDSSSPVFLRDSTGASAWTCKGDSTDYGNRAPIAGDLPVRMGDGPLNLTTGFLSRYPLHQIEATDYTYSRGRLCSRMLSALDESKGLGICKERGIDIPEQSPGPIDFNANGVIDANPVNLYRDPLLRRKWFWDAALEEQKDRDDWALLKLYPDASDWRYTAPIGVPCRTNSRWNSVTLTTCTN